MKGSEQMFNGLILIMISLMSVIVYYAFVLPKKERILYKMYKERDNLTIYAMNHPGKQDEEAYKYLIGLINVEIYLIKNSISLTDYFRTTVEETVENEQKVEQIIQMIKEDEFMGKIYENTFCIFSKYFSVKFKWFYRIFLCPIIAILKLLIIILKWIKKGNLSVREQKMNNIFSTASNMPQIYEKYLNLSRE